MKSKVCTKCGEEKLLEEFYRAKKGKFGRSSQCKACNRLYVITNKDKIKEYKKDHYKANKEEIRRKQNEARRANPEKVKQQKRESYQRCKEHVKEYARKYVKENKESVTASKKKYYKENREEIAEYKKLWYEKNKDKLNKVSRERWYTTTPEERRRKRKDYNQSLSNSTELLNKLPASDKPKFVDGYISIVCKSCGARFSPITSQILERIRCSKVVENLRGEGNFYCSEECKGSCSVYRFQPTRQTDPRSKLYIPKSEAEEARACQTDHLKQLQIDEVGHNYCEKCGEETGQVHLHHTKEIAKHGKEAISSAGHILLCPTCHKELHRSC